MEFINLINQTYLDLINEKIIYPKIKIELLDQNENSYRELIEDISSQNSGSIQCQYQQGVRQTVSFTIFDPTERFLPNPNNDLFWINRKFKIYLGLAKKKPLENYYGLTNDYQTRIVSNSTNKKDSIFITVGQANDIDEDIYWFSKGIYIVTGISIQDNEGKLINIQGVDKFGAFGNETGYNEMIANFQFDRGTKIKDLIFNLLIQDIGNGFKLDPKEPVIDPLLQDYKLPVEISKGPGSYLSDLLKELASTIQADIFYDNDGRLNIWKTMNYENYHNLQKSWNFFYGDSEYYNPSVNFDITKIANSICVVGDNPSSDNLPVARAENNNPYSPFAIQKIGRKTKYKESSFVQTQLEAEGYAKYLLKQYSINGQTLSLNTISMPHLQVDNVISITDKNLNYNNQDFIISSLDIPLGLDEIKISATNISKLPLI